MDELEALLDNADADESISHSPPTNSFLPSRTLPSPPFTPGYSSRSARTSDSPRVDLEGLDEGRPRRNGSSIGHGVTLNGAGGAGKRFSLAFELASAVAPVGRTSDWELIKSLGIDEELGEGTERYSDEEESEEEWLERARNGVTENHDDDDDDGGFMRIASHGTQEDDAYDSEISGEGDLTFDERTTALSDSLLTTSQFLLHLQQYTTTTALPSSSSPHILSSPLSTSLQRNPKSDNLSDRQPALEVLATTLIKSMYDAVKVREGQNTELRVMQREVEESDEAWDAILGGLDELEEDDGTGDSLFTLVEKGGDGVLEETQGHDQPASLTSLRQLTTSLLLTLSSITDHAQISLASNIEAGRKLRSLRSQLAIFAEDLTSLAQSEEHIRLFEAAQMRALKKENGGKGKGRYGIEARDCLMGVERALKEFEGRRKELVL